MTSSAMDVDQVLKSLASQSMKQGSNVRTAVRDLTLKAMQQRELTLDQIRKVLRSVTEGVNLGVATRELKAEKALSDTVAGMDDALLKAVEASNVALHRFTGEGYDFEDSNLKQALDELEKLEDEFLRSIATASETASEKFRAPWRRVLEKTRLSGTATGTEVASTMQDYAKRAQDGHACAARDRLQDGASAHPELRDAGQRNIDRDVRGIGRRACRCGNETKGRKGPRHHEGSPRPGCKVTQASGGKDRETRQGLEAFRDKGGAPHKIGHCGSRDIGRFATFAGRSGGANNRPRTRDHTLKPRGCARRGDQRASDFRVRSGSFVHCKGVAAARAS